VVVPFFNSKKTLPSLLDSLLSQTYPKEKYEIILVNDGSTDDSVKQIEEVQSFTVVPPIKLLHNRQKKGPANARNKGIIESGGEIIALTDSDTIPDINWLTNLINPFLNHLDNSNVGGVRGETLTDG
jgi:glycosyltransferase involved in cell wall biosynthesis